MRGWLGKMEVVAGFQVEIDSSPGKNVVQADYIITNFLNSKLALENSSDRPWVFPQSIPN